MRVGAVASIATHVRQPCAVAAGNPIDRQVRESLRRDVDLEVASTGGAGTGGGVAAADNGSGGPGIPAPACGPLVAELDGVAMATALTPAPELAGAAPVGPAAAAVSATSASCASVGGVGGVDGAADPSGSRLVRGVHLSPAPVDFDPIEYAVLQPVQQLGMAGGELAPSASGAPVGYMRVAVWSEGVGARARAALSEMLETDNIRALVLDLRDNPGGLISAVRHHSSTPSHPAHCLRPQTMTAR
eukprot:360288-Chlamydomonas_euryale.AAC.2